MAEPFYRLGEQRGPFTVIESNFKILPNGRTVEYVKDSGGNSDTTMGFDDERKFYPVSSRPLATDILLPYTIRHKDTEEGVEGQRVAWVDVSDTPYDYWRVLCQWWAREFTIIEHDVKASPEIFRELDACPEPWCYFRYSNHSEANAEAWKYGILGCTRFRDEIIRACPTALFDMQWRFRDWHHLSTGLGMTLRGAGFEPHVHGVVDHHRMMDQGGVAELMAS